MNTTLKGRRGEDHAAAYLTKHGYSIINRNFRHREGEIDVIAEKEGCLIFVEVKTWDTFSESEIEYAITGVKLKRIFNTARYFLEQNREYREKPLRFDLIFITDNFSRVEHIENAFSEVR